MIQLRKPFNGEAPISFRFGEAPEWYTKIFGYPHNGVDWAMATGRAILAADAGTVTFCDSVPDDDGMGIILAHKWGISLYWHLSRATAKQGQFVNQSDMIGQSGSSGYATGPHLHFGVKVMNEGDQAMKGWCDPLLYIKPPVDQIILDPTVPTTYLVLPGDNLWKIAEKFYNKGEYWHKIFEANKDKIKDPALIFPLTRLIIP